MRRIPYIKSVMTPFPQALEERAGLAEARKLMKAHGVAHVPVLREGRPIGLVLDRDVQAAMAGDAGPRSKVGDLCRKKAYVVDLTCPLDEVLDTLVKGPSDAALVVKEGKLVGIFTRTDACRVLGEFLRGFFPAGDDEDAA